MPPTSATTHVGLSALIQILGLDVSPPALQSFAEGSVRRSESDTAEIREYDPQKYARHSIVDHRKA
jgi:hypothetical protein